MGESRRAYRVTFRSRPAEVFLASGYEDKGGVIEFYDADIPDDETIGDRVFTRSSILTVEPLHGSVDER